MDGLDLEEDEAALAGDGECGEGELSICMVGASGGSSSVERVRRCAGVGGAEVGRPERAGGAERPPLVGCGELLCVCE